MDHAMIRKVADGFWEVHRQRDRRPLPLLPGLAIFVGVPLSGKSTMARFLAAEAPTQTLHVENDVLREEVARRLGRSEPAYDRDENFLTYRTAWALMGRGLSAGTNVIHDATSLTESGRRGAYKEADQRGAPVAVVFVRTDRTVLDTRAATVAATRLEAYLKLGRRQPDPAQCSRPHVVLDGARPVGENLEVLAGDARLLPFFAASRHLWSPVPTSKRAVGEEGDRDSMVHQR